ncbi:cold, circadian rhythm, and RNA binding 1 [Prunus dulcis]|uniref:Cold, circadian rhythm, and RNA binding 1 n=1 Tax=Prunus dulcis TaxID=3755 RepID=A0A4Y1QX15_PRUDU|nr:cold, circadian rhythm, and RNA binding 1 [Prunus dulcis]
MHIDDSFPFLSSTTERSRSFDFDFVTFNNEKVIRDAIESMNDQNLDGHNITVDEAQSCGSGSGGNRGYSGGGGGGGYGCGHSLTNCSRVQFSMNQISLLSSAALLSQPSVSSPPSFLVPGHN